MGENIKNKLYQMFILGLEGPDLSNNPNLINALHNSLGGVIFFTQNIQTIEQFKKLINDIKKEVKMSNAYPNIYPPFLSIDQEGGRVERTENLFGGKKYLSSKYAAEKGETFLINQTAQIAHELKDFGINLNFAPVLDVNTNPNNPIIGERAFSNDTEEVIKFGKLTVNIYLKNGIIPCLKHFPGHGDASVDSHITLPKIDLSLKEMEDIHIKPFQEVNAPMIMVAHMHCSAFDKEQIPSSLSKNVIGYLRKNLNYKGLIITDDMIMGGVQTQRCKEAKMQSSSHCSSGILSPLMAIKAGANILLYRNSLDETMQIIEDLAKLAQSDEELFNNIENSFDKIINLKSEFLK